MSKEIIVYFVNNCSAKFDKDNVVFSDDTPSPNYFNIGKTVLNWRNVCFVRDIPKEVVSDAAD
ncbi:MAG: hypothetical protein IKS31_00175 [Clostridia bacterium]|nr:hypothetical protein [Clostridia bacterium]